MPEELVQAVLEACKDAPDGLALDALTKARGN
jgi:hypothetical protein